MRKFRVIVFFLTLLLGGPLAQSQQTAACSQPEVEMLNDLWARAYKAGFDFAATGNVEILNGIAAYSNQVTARLSASCVAALTRVNAAIQQQSRMTGRPAQIGSVIHDAATDTYTIPNSVSCGPSGCISLE